MAVTVEPGTYIAEAITLVVVAAAEIPVVQVGLRGREMGVAARAAEMLLQILEVAEAAPALVAAAAATEGRGL